MSPLSPQTVAVDEVCKLADQMREREARYGGAGVIAWPSFF
jgi:hypothetical protein